MPRTLRRCAASLLFVVAIGSLPVTIIAQTSQAQPAPVGQSAPSPVRVSRGLLQEGAFLANQPGRLIELEQGGSAFIFDKNSEGRAVPAMAVLPCTTLMRMEQIRAARSGDVRFAVSGQVFLKGGRNYLLPTFYKVRSSANEPATRMPDTIEDDPAQDDDPTVAALIGSLDTMSPDTAGAALALPAGNLLPDGAFLKPRQGRIIHTDSGALAFSINNDADTADGPTAPLIILPSRAMTLIERMLDVHGKDSNFKISGRMYLYRGRNYLLPAMVQLQLDTTSGLSSVQ